MGTSICESAERTSSSDSTAVRLEQNAAAIRQRLEGMWVNTIVLMRPMRRASQAATGNENAPRRLAQKKYTPAASSDKLKRWKSQSASRDCTTNPPAVLVEKGDDVGHGGEPDEVEPAVEIRGAERLRKLVDDAA